MGRVLFINLLCTLLTLSGGTDSAKFEVPGIGNVKVTSTFPVGSFPTANFRDDSGRLLYFVSVGSSDPEIFRIDPAPPDVPPEWANLGPSKIVYFVVDTKGQPTSVLAIAMYTGGSDCEYAPALIGPIRGQLKSWLQQEPVVNSQGGFFVGDLGRHRGFGLAAWTFIWEDGAHYGDHRYNVRLYSIDVLSGKSSLIFNAETKQKYAQGAEALKEFGLQYENALSKSKALNC